MSFSKLRLHDFGNHHCATFLGFCKRKQIKPCNSSFYDFSDIRNLFICNTFLTYLVMKAFATHLVRRPSFSGFSTHLVQSKVILRPENPAISKRMHSYVEAHHRASSTHHTPTGKPSAERTTTKTRTAYIPYGRTYDVSLSRPIENIILGATVLKVSKDLLSRVFQQFQRSMTLSPLYWLRMQ